LLGSNIFYIIIPPTTDTTYEYIIDTTYYKTNNTVFSKNPSATFQLGKLIGSASLDSNLIWISAKNTNNTIIGFERVSPIYAVTAPPIPIDEERYIVFRKRNSANVYTYFWLKVKTLCSTGYFYVYDGKFQRNSIIIGQ